MLRIYLFTKAAFFMQESGEHMMQHKLLFAMLNSHRLINGKFMTLQELINSKIKTITVEDIKTKEY